MSEENEIEVSVVMPCLNEEKTVGTCIEKCFRVFRENNIRGEVIVVDNGSSDNSRKIILECGARLVEEPRKGYGSAYLRGFSEARGKYLVMADSDNTYDFSDIPKFVAPLKNNECEFVIGNRLKRKMASGDGAMPWLHKYIGNPVLSFLVRRLFGVNISDAHCGMRSITKIAYNKLFLKTTGMEFASEMIINATKANLRIREFSIDYRLRVGESKLRTFKDGWRHLRFMLLYSPTFLFLVPGIVLFVAGIIFLFLLLPSPLKIGSHRLDYHYMFIASLFSITGYQIINLGFFTKIFAYSEKFENEKNDKIVRFFSKHFTLERMIIIGLGTLILGLAMFFYVVYIWIQNNFGNLFEVPKMIVSITLIIIGTQTIFNAFFYSILRIEKK